ncbi:hypothetical protein Tco_0997740 [Tanacetum coccineum]
MKPIVGLIPLKSSDILGVLEADLSKTKKIYSSAYTKLTLRVKKLESQIKVGKARRHSRFVLSDTEVGGDDSSKQGRKFSNEGFQDDEGVHEKASTETELFIQEVTPTKSSMSKRQRESVKSQMNEDKELKFLEAEIARQWKKRKRKRLPLPKLEGNMIKYLKNLGNFKINDSRLVHKGRKEAVNEPAAKRKKSIPRKTTKRDKSRKVETIKKNQDILVIDTREEAPIDI